MCNRTIFINLVGKREAIFTASDRISDILYKKKYFTRKIFLNDEWTLDRCQNLIINENKLIYNYNINLPNSAVIVHCTSIENDKLTKLCRFIRNNNPLCQPYAFYVRSDETEPDEYFMKKYEQINEVFDPKLSFKEHEERLEIYFENYDSHYKIC